MDRIRSLRIAAAVVAAALLVPAAAASAGDVQTTFTVTENSEGLSISVVAGSANLGSTGATFDSAGEIDGALPATTVTDARGSLNATWAVQVEAVGTAIEQAGGDAEVPLANARVYFDQAELTGLVTTLDATLNGMTIGDAQLLNDTASLATPYDLIQGSTTTLLGLTAAPSVTYTPNMEVDVPAGTPAGDYGVTVRQTVSGS